MIRCDYGSKIFWIPKETFARIVLEQKSPHSKYVRYKTGALMYDMSERRFMDLAKDANAVYKVNRLVLVNLDIIDRYLETFREEEYNSIKEFANNHNITVTQLVRQATNTYVKSL